MLYLTRVWKFWPSGWFCGSILDLPHDHLYIVFFLGDQGTQSTTKKSCEYMNTWGMLGPSRRTHAAVNVNSVPPLVRRSTLGKKVVAQNSTLIHPGPQVNSSGIHSFSHQFSTFKPFSIRHDENLTRYSTPFIFLNDRNSTCWTNSIAQKSTPTRRLLGGDPWPGGYRVFTDRCISHHCPSPCGPRATMIYATTTTRYKLRPWKNTVNMIWMWCWADLTVNGPNVLMYFTMSVYSGDVSWFW
jgi:hypothetical protein